MTLEGSISKLAAVRPMDIPVGKMLLYGVSEGISTGVVETASALNLEAYYSAPGLIALVRLVPAVRKFLGETLSEVLSVTTGSVLLNHSDAGVMLNNRVRDMVQDAARALGLLEKENQPVEAPPYSLPDLSSFRLPEPVEAPPMIAAPQRATQMPSAKGLNEIAKRIGAIRM